MMQEPSSRELATPIYGENAVSIQHYDRPPGNYCFPLHWHERMELLRVYEGELEMRLAGSTYILKPGMMAIVGPRQTHSGSAGPQGVVYDVIIFEPRSFQCDIPAVRSVIEPLLDARLMLTPICEILALVEAFDAVVASSAEDPLKSVGDVFRLLSVLMQHASPRLMQRHSADERFLTVVQYVEQHYLEPLSVAALSAQFGYETSYFCRRFKRSTGLSLLKFVEILRLEQAQRMIRQTRDPIGRIALQCGFRDVCYFSSRFHAHFGKSPSAYRKE